jgi:hypothetical protein
MATIRRALGGGDDQGSDSSPRTTDVACRWWHEHSERYRDTHGQHWECRRLLSMCRPKFCTDARPLCPALWRATQASRAPSRHRFTVLLYRYALRRSYRSALLPSLLSGEQQHERTGMALWRATDRYRSHGCRRMSDSLRVGIPSFATPSTFRPASVRICRPDSA